MWLCLNSGSERRTRRWLSSSDWSWCLWRRSSKSHKVGGHVWKYTQTHTVREGQCECCSLSLPRCDDLFFFFLCDKILQSPRDKSWSRLPTNHPSPSQEWPSLRIAAEPPSVPSCNWHRPLYDPVLESETTHSHHTTCHTSLPVTQRTSVSCVSPRKLFRNQVHNPQSFRPEFGNWSLISARGGTLQKGASVSEDTYPQCMWRKENCK